MKLEMNIKNIGSINIDLENFGTALNSIKSNKQIDFIECIEDLEDIKDGLRNTKEFRYLTRDKKCMITEFLVNSIIELRKGPNSENIAGIDLEYKNCLTQLNKLVLIYENKAIDLYELISTWDLYSKQNGAFSEVDIDNIIMTKHHNKWIYINW